jgi:hypothetical protein
VLVDDRRAAALGVFAEMLESGRIRDSSIDAILLAGRIETGTMIISKPRSPNRPIEVSLLTGGVSFTVTETRGITEVKP